MQEVSKQQQTEELLKRIETVEALGDAELGSFNRWDWTICIIGGVIIPAVLLWWYA